MQSNVPFFPLYPMLWKAVMLVTGWPTYVCALFVSNILALGGFVVFYRWLSVVWGEGIAKRGLLALAVFPTSFFLISAYSDSTLLILLASAMLLAERGRWKTAALVALLASAARPVGIFLGPVLIWLWWNKNKNNKIKNWFDVLSLLFLSPLGLFFFSAYLWHQVGDPLAWLHGQVYYSRSFESPLRLLYSYAVCIIRLGPTWVLNVEELSALLLTVVCLPRLYKIRPVFAFWAVLNLLPSLFSGRLTSLDRYVLLIIPIFIVVAMQKKWIYFSYLFVSTVMMITYVSRFVIGYWAG